MAFNEGYYSDKENTGAQYSLPSATSAVPNGSWSDILDNIDDMSSEDIMRWAVNNPELAEKNPSFIDTLISQKYARSNFDYEYQKNNDIEYLMNQMKKAGINPTLAFRSSLNTGSISSPSSGYATDLSRKASLEETKAKREQSHEEFVATLAKAFGVIVLSAVLMA